MKNRHMYTRINTNLPYNAIGREISGKLEQYRARDIRFVRTKKTELMYDVYIAFSGKNPPPLDSFNFIGVCFGIDLSRLIDSELDRDSLPKEIRVITPSSQVGDSRNIKGLFFKE